MKAGSSRGDIGGGGVAIGIDVNAGDNGVSGDTDGGVNLWGDECVASGSAAVSVDRIDAESSSAPFSASSWEALSLITGSIIFSILSGEPPIDATGDDGPELKLYAVVVME